MAAALSQWLENDVQPLAITHLGAPIAKVEIMSDYACRASTGRLHNRLSEHAFADALDIGAFVTGKGHAVRVLAQWGKTQRDVVAEAEAAAKAKAAAKEAEAAKAAETDKTKTAEASNSKTTQPQQSTDQPKQAAQEKTAAREKRKSAHPTLKLAAAKLGGPDLPKAKRETMTPPAPQDTSAPPGAPALVAPAPATPDARFLHEAHAAACKIFGTTLGPEANEDHRNHFHVDMAERKYKKICD
jgi:hypothetical protein